MADMQVKNKGASDSNTLNYLYWIIGCVCLPGNYIHVCFMSIFLDNNHKPTSYPGCNGLNSSQ